MLRRSRLFRYQFVDLSGAHTGSTSRYVGGVGVNHPILGTGLMADKSRIIGVEKAAVANDWSVDPSALSGNFKPWRWEPTYRELRADLYDELLKLPLRYKMHSFDVVNEAMSKSAVGYHPPLGAVDKSDTLPFFVHRDSNGRFATSLMSINNKTQMPVFVLYLQRIDGDLFRFEDELIKILPNKKTFVENKGLKVFNAAEDARCILEHWFIGLGF
jgi:hypothetical protein